MTQYSTQARRLEALYAELQPQLMRILVSNLQGPEWVLDEACQVAWGSLLLQAPELAAGGELGGCRRPRHVPRCDRSDASATPIRTRSYRNRSGSTIVASSPVRNERSSYGSAWPTSGAYRCASSAC